MKDVNSVNSNAGLTPGVSLNPLKCWTAQFTGLGGRLVWLLCESVEGSPTSIQTTCKYTKKTMHAARHLQCTKIDRASNTSTSPLFTDKRPCK